MHLRFDPKHIKHYAGRYEERLNSRDLTLTTKITTQVFPAYWARGYLTQREFRDVCDWKSPRTRRWCEANDAAYVREISAAARRTKCERLRIELWTLLDGVNWPTASVFLHFGFTNRYPILDFRALWSLGVDVPPQYDFAFWWSYVEACRTLARTHSVPMRTLDQALWQHSKEHQGQ